MARRKRRFPVVGMVASLAVLAAACSAAPAPPPAPRSSPLTSSAPLTCGASAASCAAPGTLRWSLPLPGADELDGGGGTLLDLGTAQAAGPGSLEPGGVASAPSLIVYQQGGLVIAIDPATGRKRWSRSLGAGVFDSSVPVIGDGEVAALASPVGQDGVPGDAWVLNAATGAAGQPIALPCGTKTSSGCNPPDVLAVTGRNLVVLAAAGVEGLDTATGAVRWHAPADPRSPHAVIGGVLYADQTAAAIQRIDLATGAAMTPLPLEPSLRGGAVLTSDAGTGALLVAARTAVARLNPATGRVIWARGWSGDAVASAFTFVKTDPASSPPTALLLDFPSRAVRYDWRLRVISLTTGAPEFTLRYSQAVARHYQGITTWNADNWSVSGSDLLSQSPAPGRKVSDLTTGRLIGLDPASGRRLWQGPSSDADQTVLAETAAAPHLIIVVGCAPGAITLPSDNQAPFADAVCHQPRLYAINA